MATETVWEMGGEGCYRCLNLLNRGMRTWLGWTGLRGRREVKVGRGHLSHSFESSLKLVTLGHPRFSSVSGGVLCSVLYVLIMVSR